MGFFSVSFHHKVSLSALNDFQNFLSKLREIRTKMEQQPLGNKVLEKRKAV